LILYTRTGKTAVSTVIVIDDYEQMAALIAERISAGGFSAVYASGGEAAVEELRRQKESGEEPCICVCDVVMSGLSGVDLMREIKTIGPGIRFILITGYTDVPAIARMQEEGTIDIMYKPFKIEELISKINFVVSNQKRLPVS